jgi:myo-inositol 2-dehydrogenase/D-chiro-inositol 1-dehydrogenase/scyllo-inositol 2-dehydrogenase (NAD+)
MTDTIRVCLVGAGRAGQVHANSLANHIPGAELAAVVDAKADARAAAARMFGARSQFASLEDALEGASFDAVVITTPTFTHRELALRAAAAGKHILCEKPMALNLAECDDMIAAAARAGVLLQIGFMRRFDPEFEAAAARIEAGEIGRPMLIKSLTHGPGLPPAWAHDLAVSNGMLAEVNSHDWDAVRWLAHSDPVRVYAEVANFKGAERGVTAREFYDCAIAQVRFESGAMAAISGVCPCEYGYDSRVEIVGERGILQIGDLRGQAVVVCTNRDQGLVTPIYRTWPERYAEAYIREMRHFLDCIRGGRAPRAGGPDGRWAVAGVLAATLSFRERRPVELAEVLAPASGRRTA